MTSQKGKNDTKAQITLRGIGEKINQGPVSFLLALVTYPLKFFGMESKRNSINGRFLGRKYIDYIKKNYGLVFLDVYLEFYPSSLKEVFIDKVYDAFPVDSKDVILDCGATVGEYGLYCFKKGSTTYSFESNSEYFKVMKKIIKLNCASAKVIPFLAEIGKRNTLDGFVKKLKIKPTLLKIDIEGFEHDALLGAKKLLKTCPRIIIETHSKDLENKCLFILKNNGYKICKKWNREKKILYGF